MSAQKTPTGGEWRVSDCDPLTGVSNGYDVMTTDAAGEPLCVASDLRSLEDAHLIAASKDLLAVTRRWLRVMGNAGARCSCSSRKGEEYVCCRCEIEAAIARAEGRQP